MLHHFVTAVAGLVTLLAPPCYAGNSVTFPLAHHPHLEDSAFVQRFTSLTRPKYSGECRTGNDLWPPLPKKIDLVISWWTDKPQSSHKTGKSLLELDTALGFRNQAEVKYAIRSFEEFGLLEYVERIFLLVDEEVLNTYGAPRDLDYSKVHIVTDKDIGVDNSHCDHAGGMSRGCGKWSKRLRMHTIPGLSDYFLFVPDDLFLLKKFDMSYLWDAVMKRPVIYSYGGWKQGWCDGEAVGAGHGPILINTCAMRAVETKYAQDGFSGGNMSLFKEIDALCIYSNFVRFSSTFRSWRETSTSFFQECHINPIERCSIRHLQGRAHVFVNLQGDGVSDDAPANVLETEMAGNFFDKTFPSPSMFEISTESQKDSSGEDATAVKHRSSVKNTAGSHVPKARDPSFAPQQILKSGGLRPLHQWGVNEMSS